MSERDDLLAQAQEIQNQKTAQIADNDLLSQAKAIQNKKITQPAPEPSIGDTVLGQGLQGATVGFADELAGLGQAGLQAASGLTGYSPGPKEGNNFEAVKAAYLQMRDAERNKSKAQQEANPITSIASNIAGATPLAIATGGQSLAGAVALGGASGLGSSESDLANKGLEAVPGTLKDVAIGSALGAGGYGAGKLIGKALNPKSLEVAGSKMASSAVGVKPAKELAREYSQELGRNVEGSDIIRGIGKTAMDEGALPLTGGASNIYDKSLEAIDNQYNRLNPIIKSTQQKLDQNLPQSLDAAGHIGDKAGNFLYGFRDSLNENPNQDIIMKKLEGKYLPYIQKLSQSDGNLLKLNNFKRELQDLSTDLSAAAYDMPASNLKPEAAFVKRLGGIVRQHIEDLASTIDPGAGQQIGQINKTLSNLYTYKDASKNLMNKPSISLGKKDVGALGVGFLAGGPLGAAITEGSKLALELTTGNPIGRLSKILGAKGLNQASKAIATPAGELVQKTAQAAPLATGMGASNFKQADNDYNPQQQSPWNEERLQEKPSNTIATKTSANLYNATDDSLKEVANNLKKVQGLNFYGEHLDKAINMGDDGEKKRAIFLILQNPRSRKLISPEKRK